MLMRLGEPVFADRTRSKLRERLGHRMMTRGSSAGLAQTHLRFMRAGRNMGGTLNYRSLVLRELREERST